MGSALRGAEEALRAHDGGLRWLSDPHRLPHWPADRFPEEHRRVRQHADHGHLRQRRQRRGRATGTINEAQFFNNVQDRSKRTWRSWTSLAARRPSTTTPGAGPGQATRRSAAGSARPTEAASATRSSCTGRKESKRRAKSARSTLTPSTWCRLCSTRWALSRQRLSRVSPSHPSKVSASPTASTMPRRPPSTSPNTSRCSAIAHSTTMAGGRSVPGRVPRLRKRANPSARPSRPRR